MTQTLLSPGAQAGALPGLSQAIDRLSAMDHALRTPLGTLMNTFELLRLEPDAATVAQAVAMMERQVRQMMTQVGELRDIAELLRGLDSVDSIS